jgi:carboxyl-terminal processing protease
MLLGLLILPAIAQSDDFGKTWDQVASAIRTRYYAREQRKSEMDGLLAQFGPRAKAAKSRAEFEDLTNEMIRDFHDSHFGFFTLSDQGYYLMDSLVRSKSAKEMPEFGAWFASAPASGGGYTVTMVLDGSEAEKAGLRKGDVIVKVGDQPFTPIDSIAPLVGKSAQLTFQRAGKEMHAQVNVSSEAALPMFLDASKASSRVIDDHGRKIGYFHLWTLASTDFKNAMEGAVYGRLRDTDGFILDLRDGFGGRPEGYGDVFFRPNVWLDWKYSPKSGFRELYGYGRPLVVLINGGSRSAKEVMSYIFKRSGRAELVGQTTAGNVLGTFPQRLNDWAYIEVPVMDVITDGKRLEGVGVSPNVQVSPEFNSQGQDMDLQAGLREVERKVSARR